MGNRWLDVLIAVAVVDAVFLAIVLGCLIEWIQHNLRHSNRIASALERMQAQDRNRCDDDG